METQQETKEGEMHPLAKKEVCYISSWSRWKELWEKESNVEILHSLLHFGFGVAADSNEAAERICLYLDIADTRHESFRIFPEKNNYHLSPLSAFGFEVETWHGLRMVLVQKAYQMLCQNLFKNTAEKDYYAPSWLHLVAHPQVLAKLIWFFRGTKEGGNIPNLSGLTKEHHLEIAEKFALDFCLFAWDCDGPRYHQIREVTEEIKELFRSVRLDTISILFSLGEIDALLDEHRRQNVDKKCMKKLEELVMNRDLSLPKTNAWGNEWRKPKTIEEACLGSWTAHVLLVLKTIQAEQKRFDELQKLEEERREAEEKIKKLS